MRHLCLSERAGHSVGVLHACFARQSVKWHMENQRERANFDYQWHQNPWNFSNLNLTSIITSRSSTPVQIFIPTCSAPDITVLWLFSLVSYTVFLFLRHVPRSNPWMDYHSLWLIRRVFTQGRSFWGLQQYLNSFGVISPKTSQKGSE